MQVKIGLINNFKTVITVLFVFILTFYSRRRIRVIFYRLCLNFLQREREFDLLIIQYSIIDAINEDERK